MKGKEGMKKPVSTTVITLLILILLSGCGNAEKYAKAKEWKDKPKDVWAVQVADMYLQTGYSVAEVLERAEKSEIDYVLCDRQENEISIDDIDLIKSQYPHYKLYLRNTEGNVRLWFNCTNPYEEDRPIQDCYVLTITLREISKDPELIYSCRVLDGVSIRDLSNMKESEIDKMLSNRDIPLINKEELSNYDWRTGTCYYKEQRDGEILFCVEEGLKDKYIGNLYGADVTQHYHYIIKVYDTSEYDEYDWKWYPPKRWKEQPEDASIMDYYSPGTGCIYVGGHY